MKKIFYILIPALLLALLIFLTLQFIVKYQVKKGALQITSSPASKVYVNNDYLGQTPLCKCDASDMLTTGDYTIRLVPADKNFSEFQEKITISEEVLTVVDRKFGKDSLSEGSVISLSPLDDKKKTQLLIASFPQEATVLLDDNTIGQTPLLFKDPTESDHVLTVQKNGYKEKTIRIRTPLGYKLTVAVYLSTSTDADLSSTPTVTNSVTPAPSQPPATVTILDTPTGFLRVRDSNEISAAEVGQVSPGETFELIDEQVGWFKIKLKDGKQGWISSQYSKKQ